MLYLILGIVILAAILILLNRLAYGQPATILRLGRILFVLVILALAGFLVMRGGFQFLWLAILALIPWIGRVQMLLALGRLFHNFRQQRHRRGENQAGQPMTRKDALKILGLEEGASKEEIKKAHWRLMQQHHPDQGGDPEKASLINQAKDMLLER